MNAKKTPTTQQIANDYIEAWAGHFSDGKEGAADYFYSWLTTFEKQAKKFNLSTLDLSPRMIGKTIRVDKYYSSGNHNWIEGKLTGLSVETHDIYSNDGLIRTVDATLTGIRATIAGLDFYLDGTEQLTIIENGD